MKTTLFALVAACALSLTLAPQVSAAPADGAAIARIGHQVDPTINVATKKKKTAAKKSAKDEPKPGTPDYVQFTDDDDE